MVVVWIVETLIHEPVDGINSRGSRFCLIMHDCPRHCLRHLHENNTNQYKLMPFRFHVITCSFALRTEFQLGTKREISRRESAKWNPNKWNRATMIMVPGGRAIVEIHSLIQFRQIVKAVFQSNHVLILPSRRCRAWLCPRMEYRIKKGKTKSHGEITAIRTITNLSNPVVSEAIGNRIMRCSLRRPFM